MHFFLNHHPELVNILVLIAVPIKTAVIISLAGLSWICFRKSCDEPVYETLNLIEICHSEEVEMVSKSAVSMVDPRARHKDFEKILVCGSILPKKKNSYCKLDKQSSICFLDPVLN